MVTRDNTLKKVSTNLTWENAPEVLTVEEAATLVRIPRNAAYGAVRAGLLPATNFGQRRLRVLKSVLKQVFSIGLEQNTATAASSVTFQEA